RLDELGRDLLRQEVTDVVPDDLLAGAKEGLAPALRLEVRPVPRDPEHQVRDRIEQSAAAGLAAPERLQAAVLLDREPGGGDDLVEQPALVEQRRVVDERGQRMPVRLAVDAGGDAPVGVRLELD